MMILKLPWGVIQVSHYLMDIFISIMVMGVTGCYRQEKYLYLRHRYEVDEIKPYGSPSLTVWKKSVVPRIYSGPFGVQYLEQTGNRLICPE